MTRKILSLKGKRNKVPKQEDEVVNVANRTRVVADEGSTLTHSVRKGQTKTEIGVLTACRCVHTLEKFQRFSSSPKDR